METKQFKAESQRLLDLMINSIYTHKEIFLREIISNASDAMDKLAYTALTDEKVGINRDEMTITITRDKDAGLLTVSDTGIGIPEEHQPHIFERFYSVEKERVAPSSTGLGLAICKQIVERPGGRLRAEKGPGGRFVFTIPLAR